MSRDSWRTYSEQAAATPQIVFDVTSVNGMVLASNVIVAVIIMVGMVRDQHSTTVAVIVAGAYYLASTVLIVLVLSGALTNMVVNRQREVTERYKWQVLETQQIPQVELPRLPDRRSTDVAQTGNYVPPVDDGVRREAVTWLVSLFDADGQLDRRKVMLHATDKTPAGRIKVKMPSKAAIEYLVLRKVVREFMDARGFANGYGLRLRLLPYRSALDQLNL